MTFKPLALSSLILVSTATHAVSFIDEIDGQLDMGEYLAENAYGFLPVPILITEPAVGYGGGFTGIFMHESEEQKNTRKELAEKSIDGGARFSPLQLLRLAALRQRMALGWRLLVTSAVGMRTLYATLVD